MSLSSTQQNEWRLIFDIVLMSLLFLLLLLTLVLVFFKQKNVPVSQCIEVDPREPHSITITFVPATVVGTSVLNNTNQQRTPQDQVAMTNTATDAAGMTQTSNGSVISTHDSQTAPIA